MKKKSVPIVITNAKCQLQKARAREIAKKAKC